jgi:hypothetical protein
MKPPVSNLAPLINDSNESAIILASLGSPMNGTSNKAPSVPETNAYASPAPSVPMKNIIWKELGHVVATVHSDQFLGSPQPHISLTDETLASISAS